MPYFEVFIPSTEPDGFNITARIQANSWIQALRSGLSKLGDTADVKNIMVDITETGIDVTEPHSGRVFRIRELGDEPTGPKPMLPTPTPTPAAAQPVLLEKPVIKEAPPRAAQPGSAPTPIIAAPPPAAARPAPAPGPVFAAPPPAAARSAGVFNAPPPAARVPQPAVSGERAFVPPPAPVVAAPSAAGGAPSWSAQPLVLPHATQGPAMAAQAPRVPSPTVVAEPPPAGIPKPAPIAPAPKPGAATPWQTGPQAVTVADTRRITGRFQAPDVVELESVQTPSSDSWPSPIGRGRSAPGRPIDEIMADLFDETQELYNFTELNLAADFILDLAMRHIPAESGSVFIADINSTELSFAAARGPKAKEVMGFRVPMGVGIVGFSAMECVSLAVSDVHRDPKFYAAISKSIGYDTRSIICAPVHRDGRSYGAIELINKTGGASFADDDVTVLNYLGRAFVEYLINSGFGGD